MPHILLMEKKKDLIRLMLIKNLTKSAVNSRDIII